MTSILTSLLSFLTTRAFLSPITTAVLEQNKSPKDYREILKEFLTALNYDSPGGRREVVDLTGSQIYKSLLSEFSPYDNGDGWFEAMCLEATALTELPYPEHKVEVKLQIAQFIWYLLYIDDLGHKIPAKLKVFQHGVLANRQAEEPLLRGFQGNLAQMSDYWDAIAANCITVAGMEFVTGRLIEVDPSIGDMRPSSLATSWPNYLRVKTGASPAFAFFIYPTASLPDISSYIQMIEDIRFFLDYVNDLLSFHKEALAGETNNYIHYRAGITGKTVLETLQEVAGEVLAAHSRITQVLEFTEASKPWKLFADGVLDFHLSMKRYRLSDLGL